MKEQSAAFVVLVEDESDADVARTLESLKRFRPAASRDVRHTQAFCACSLERAAGLSSVAASTGVTLYSGEAEFDRLPGVPSIASLLNDVVLHIHTACVVLVTPGVALDDHATVVSRAIRAVGRRDELLYLPNADLHEPPVWAVFSLRSLQFRGITTTAADGWTVKRTSRFFGGARFSRCKTDSTGYDAPKLISAVAYEFQRDRSGQGLKIRQGSGPGRRIALGVTLAVVIVAALGIGGGASRHDDHSHPVSGLAQETQPQTPSLPVAVTSFGVMGMLMGGLFFLLGNYSVRASGRNIADIAREGQLLGKLPLVDKLDVYCSDPVHSVVLLGLLGMLIFGAGLLAAVTGGLSLLLRLLLDH